MLIFCINIILFSKKQISLSYAKSIVSLSMPIVEFEDKDGAGKNSLMQEIRQMKKYVLGIGNSSPREIISIQLGLDCSNPRRDYRRCAVKTNVEGLSSIYFIGEEKNNDEDVSYSELKITNETNYNIDVQKLLKEPLKRKFNQNSKILIYHTHTNESYIKNISDLRNTSVLPRSKNENINVVRVGQELCDNLNKFSVPCVHSKKYHNIPNDKGAYARSLNTVREYIGRDPNIVATLDIHRDGISNSKKLRVVEKVKDKDVAKIMIVIGTDGTGLSHREWRENLKFALKLQEKLIQYNPNIVKPVLISKNRYNQHLTNCSLLIEIGGDGNTIDESLESARYIARALSEIYQENKKV